MLRRKRRVVARVRPVDLPITIDVTARRDAYRQLEGKLVDIPWRAGNTWQHVRGVIAYSDEHEVGLVSIDRHQVILPLSVVGRPIEVWED